VIYFSISYYKLTIVTSIKFLRHEKETEQELILETDSGKRIFSDSDSGHDKDSTTVGSDINASGS